jgi:hypothetical protein
MKPITLNYSTLPPELQAILSVLHFVVLLTFFISFLYKYLSLICHLSTTRQPFWKAIKRDEVTLRLCSEAGMSFLVLLTPFVLTVH